MTEAMIGPILLGSGQMAWVAPRHVTLVLVGDHEAWVKAGGESIRYDTAMNEDIHRALMDVLRSA